VVGPAHRVENGLEVIDDLRIVAGDLRVPDPAELTDRASLGVGDLGHMLDHGETA
jgi:hypothetical protein